MSGRHGRWLLAGILLGLAGQARAQEAEPLPPPRTVPGQAIVPPPVFLPPPPHRIPQYRENRYAVWHYYGVDRRGHFRPRVVYWPGGAYYLYNGHPYPWVSTHQLDWMPFIVD